MLDICATQLHVVRALRRSSGVLSIHTLERPFRVEWAVNRALDELIADGVFIERYPGYVV